MKVIENKILEIIERYLGREYKRNKNIFYKDCDDFFHLVEVQFLRIGPDEKSITIYFGVIVPKILQLLWGDKYKSSDFRKLTTRNGVFNCNINDIIENFKGKPKIKYWDLKNDDSLIDEIGNTFKNKMIPFINMFNSLNQLNEIIDEVEYPFKNSTDIPVMILALKFILNRNEEFYKIAKHLKTSNNHFASLVDKLVEKKSFE